MGIRGWSGVHQLQIWSELEYDTLEEEAGESARDHLRKGDRKQESAAVTQVGLDR